MLFDLNALLKCHLHAQAEMALHTMGQIFKLSGEEETPQPLTEQLKAFFTMM